MQSVKPTQVRHHAWAHNGIQEGHPGCEYINASQNTDSPAKWARMALKEEQANAQLRRIPLVQGGGMGIYAAEDIWHGQEVLLVNQEQTNDSAEDSRHSLVEERELSQEWDEDGDPQGQGQIQKAPESLLPRGIQLITLPWIQAEKCTAQEIHGEMGPWYSALHQPQ